MEGVSGKYLVDCVVKEFCKGVKDDDVVKKLWDFSVRLVKLDKWILIFCLWVIYVVSVKYRDVFIFIMFIEFNYSMYKV